MPKLRRKQAAVRLTAPSDLVYATTDVTKGGRWIPPRQPRYPAMTRWCGSSPTRSKSDTGSARKEGPIAASESYPSSVAQPKPKLVDNPPAPTVAQALANQQEAGRPGEVRPTLRPCLECGTPARPRL
jgi:hypothetical protein